MNAAPSGSNDLGSPPNRWRAWMTPPSTPAGAAPGTVWGSPRRRRTDRICLGERVAGWSRPSGRCPPSVGSAVQSPRPGCRRRRTGCAGSQAPPPVDPGAREDSQQRHFLGEPKRVVERDQRNRRTNPEPLGASRGHGTHHVHRQADGKARKMMFGQPDGIVARLDHDGKAFERRFVNRIERHGAVAPAEEPQNSDFRGSPPATERGPSGLAMGAARTGPSVGARRPWRCCVSTSRMSNQMCHS
jgi:hypothetical protein